MGTLRRWLAWGLTLFPQTAIGGRYAAAPVSLAASERFLEVFSSEIWEETWILPEYRQQFPCFMQMCSPCAT